MSHIKRFDQFVNEANTFDITKDKKSIAGKLEDFIGKMAKLQFEEIKSEFKSIIEDPETHASDATRAKWMGVINTARNKVMLMHAISNLYLKAAQLGLDPKNN